MNIDLYQKALQIINFSPQMELSLKRKLLKKNFNEEEINTVIELLKEQNYLNDEYHGELYANELVRLKFAGINRVIKKLLEKGINKNIAQQLARQAIEDNGGEEEIIKKYVSKNLTFFTDNISKNNQQKILNKLYNNGFKKFSIKYIQKILDELKDH